jgi:hypothetical protein
MQKKSFSEFFSKKPQSLYEVNFMSLLEIIQKEIQIQHCNGTLGRGVGSIDATLPQ